MGADHNRVPGVRDGAPCGHRAPGGHRVPGGHTKRDLLRWCIPAAGTSPVPSGCEQVSSSASQEKEQVLMRTKFKTRECATAMLSQMHTWLHAHAHTHMHNHSRPVVGGRVGQRGSGDRCHSNVFRKLCRIVFVCPVTQRRLAIPARGSSSQLRKAERRLGYVRTSQRRPPSSFSAHARQSLRGFACTCRVSLHHSSRYREGGQPVCLHDAVCRRAQATAAGEIFSVFYSFRVANTGQVRGHA